MTRERFDDGSTRPDGSTFTLDSPQSWGGSGGTYTNHVRPNGTSYMDFLGNGETQDVNRYRQMGEDAQNRGAYQLDWADADKDNANSDQAGGVQGDANDVLRKQAMGQDNVSSDFQQGLLQKGAQQQQGAALSSAGGPLAQIGAAARTQNGQAAFMQRGNANIAANRANDMAQGRTAWAAGLAAQRKNDLMSQGLNDQQAEAQAQSELAQRDLNDQRQLHDEGMAVNTEESALESRQHQAANTKAVSQAQYDKNQADRNRGIGYVTGGIKIIGNAAAPGVGDAAAAGGTAAVQTNTSEDPNNPANQPVSDERAKDKKPGALVSLYDDFKARGLGTESGDTTEWDQDAGNGVGHSRDVTMGTAPASSSSAGASLSGPTPKFSSARPSAKSAASAPARQKKRPMTPAEIEAFAKQMQAETEAQKEMLKNGPSVGARDRAEEEPKGAKAALNFKIDSDAGDTGAGEMSRADTFGTPKKKPLLLSVAEDSGGQSQMLPSDEILDNWRTAHQQPDAKPGDAPAPDAYDRSMFSRNDDGNIGTDALHAGIESKMAHDQKMRDDYARDNAEDKANAGKYSNRRGTVGDVLGGGPKATYDLGFGKGRSGDRGLAPGTEDAIAHGAMRPDLSKDEASWRDYKSDGKTHNFDDYSSAIMTSDERAKNVMESPEQKKAREDKEDAEEIAKFNQGSPDGGVSYDFKKEAAARSPEEEKEKRDKDAYEVAEAGREQRRTAAAEEQRQKAAYVDAEDAKYTQEQNGKLLAPDFVKRRNSEELARRQARPEAERAAQAEHYRAGNDRTAANNRSLGGQESKWSNTVGDAVRSSSVGRAIMSIGEGLPGGKRRQPTSFTRGDDEDVHARSVAASRGLVRESTSDEDTKNVGYRSDKGAGGGEEEEDGTTMEHRGPAVTEADPVASDSSRGVPGGGESHENDQTTVGRGNPLIEMQKDANRRLAGQTYTYKPGFGEDPEKMHHGFMAQELEKNPITALAVVDDGTGVKKVDNVEALRHAAAGVASLQEQHDELEDAVAALVSRRKKRSA